MTSKASKRRNVQYIKVGDGDKEIKIPLSRDARLPRYHLKITILRQAFPQATGVQFDDVIAGNTLLLLQEGIFQEPPGGWHQNDLYHVISDVTLKKDNKENKIKSLIESLKGKRKEKKQKKNVEMETKVKDKKIRIHMGWKHYSEREKKFKLIKFKSGGGVRVIEHKDGRCSVNEIKELGAKVFFPRGESDFGNITEMKITIGNYKGEHITEFTDISGQECDFLTHIKDFGLYPSRYYLYLLTRKDTDRITTKDKESTNNIPPDSTIKRRSPSEDPLVPVSSLDGTADHLTRAIEVKFCLNVTLEDREVSFETACTGREACFDLCQLNNPSVKDEGLGNFNPIAQGYEVRRISKIVGKDETIYLDSQYEDSEESNEDPILITNFPQKESGKKASSSYSALDIFHGPDEIWGYENNQLILGCVVSCHGPWVKYFWTRDDREYIENTGQCVIFPRLPGTYRCVVDIRGNIIVSDPIDLTFRKENASKKSKGVEENEKIESNQPEEKTWQGSNTVPEVKKSDLEFADQVGEGSFGKVFKGTWAGTRVAIKEIKVPRQQKHLFDAAQQEIAIHSRVRHPNIVQLMAIAFTKKEIYMVCEFVKGCNLEEIIFENSLSVNDKQKISVARQITQAVCYLHCTDIVHGDIKPANILVSKDTFETKLCDLGISKLKSANTVTQTQLGGIPGSPLYMAPESLLKGKLVKASDIWSLACTLIELFSGRDAWLIVGGDGREQLCKRLRNEEIPDGMKYIPENFHNMRNLISKGLVFKISDRITALAMLDYF